MSMMPSWRRVPAPGSWVQHAACRHTERAEQFDPADADSGETPQQRRERVHSALAYCRACPVASSCLSYALAYGLIGVWGGHYLDFKHPRRHRQLRTRSPLSGGSS